jgi:hypothetical protein
LVEAASAQLLGDFGGDPDTHIARNQQLFQLEQRRIIQPAAVENRVDARVQPLRAARHARLEAGEPTAAFLGFGVGKSNLCRRGIYRSGFGGLCGFGLFRMSRRRGVPPETAAPQPALLLVGIARRRLGSGILLGRVWLG